MNSLHVDMLLQCSCSGDGRSNPLLLLAIFAGALLLFNAIKMLIKSKGTLLMNKTMKITIVLVLIVIVGVVVAIKQQGKKAAEATNTPLAIGQNPQNLLSSSSDTGNLTGIPRMVDLGAGKCVPCKLMKPILDELREQYKGKMDVVFIDVWENPAEARKYSINIIPTQIFYDKDGKELFRHEGFYSKEDILGKWKELDVELAAVQPQPEFSRLEPAKADTRPKDQICYMCDGDINPKTLVVVKTDKGDVRMCGLHCYFIMYSCLTEDKTDFEKKVSVTDYASGNLIPLTDAAFVYGVEKSGRPAIGIYADANVAKAAQQTSGGNIIGLEALKENELSHRCGFCDRSCYPQDASKVLVSGIQTWGCCSHCALGVAARTGKDIEVHEKDRLTGDPIVIKTLDGSVASLEPSTAVAWFGQRKKPDGSWASAGCFHQGFFTSADNLKKWVEQNPYETGKLISIHQALADKMKLSTEQIQKACKIGECAPK